MKGLEGTPGLVGLDLDTKNYNRDQFRMLQAALSKDPKRIVGFLVEEIGEAAGTCYGGKDRASNGIAIKEKPVSGEITRSAPTSSPPSTPFGWPPHIACVTASRADEQTKPEQVNR